MIRLTLRVAVLLGVFTTILFAADFWKNKPFVDWDKSEVYEMLHDSPWAKTVQLSMSGPGYGSLPGGGSLAGGVGGESAAGGRNVRDDGCSECRVPGSNEPLQPPQSSMAARREAASAHEIELQVLIINALPVRRALARLNCGTELDGECSRRLLNLQDDRYIVAVAGLPNQMLPGDGNGEPGDSAQQPDTQSGEALQLRHQRIIARLAEDSTLKVKGKEPLHPSQVQIGDGPLPDIYMFFPRANEGGWDLTTDDKKVEFEMKLHSRRIRQTFKLKNMMYEGKLEI